MSSDNLPPILLHLLFLLAQVLLWVGEQLPCSWETQDYSSVFHITCHSIFHSNSSQVCCESLMPASPRQRWEPGGLWQGGHPFAATATTSQAPAGLSVPLKPPPMVSSWIQRPEAKGWRLRACFAVEEKRKEHKILSHVICLHPYDSLWRRVGYDLLVYSLWGFGHPGKILLLPHHHPILLRCLCLSFVLP